MGFAGFTLPEDLTIVKLNYGGLEGAGAVDVTYCPADNAKYEEVLQALFSGTGMNVTNVSDVSVSSPNDVVRIQNEESQYTYRFYLVGNNNKYAVTLDYWVKDYQLFSLAYEAQTLRVYISEIG